MGLYAVRPLGEDGVIWTSRRRSSIFSPGSFCLFFSFTDSYYGVNLLLRSYSRDLIELLKLLLEIDADIDMLAGVYCEYHIESYIFLMRSFEEDREDYFFFSMI